MTALHYIKENFDQYGRCRDAVNGVLLVLSTILIRSIRRDFTCMARMYFVKQPRKEW